MQSYSSTLRLCAGLLLLLSGACREAVAPEYPPFGDAGSSDMELDLPALRQLSSNTPTFTQASRTDSSETTPNTFATLQDVPPMLTNIGDGALITRLEVDVGFMSDSETAYAQVIGESRGSSYRNHILLSVKYGNTKVGENEGYAEESCLCLHLFEPWGETASTTVSISGACGHIAEATGSHSARADFLLPDLKILQALRDVRTANASKRQAACPPTSGDGLGGSPTGDEDWYLCYWEDTYDAYGNFVQRRDLGCQPIGSM